MTKMHNNFSDRRKWFFFFSLVLMAIIFWLSSLSTLVSISKSNLPAWWIWLIDHVNIRWGGKGFFSYSLSLHPAFLLHKLGHVFFYGLLGICVFRAWGNQWRPTLMVIVLFAFVDEWHQSLIPGRDGRFIDVVLDTIAAWVAVKLYRVQDVGGWLTLKRNRGSATP